MRIALLLGLCLALACGDDDGGSDSGGTDAGRDAPELDAPGFDGGEDGGENDGGDDAGGDDAGGDAGMMGPNVDRTDPQLWEHELEPDELDEAVVNDIETQYAQLDTRVEPIGKLVFFLSGYTNVPRSWRDHGRMLASFGFHVVLPHYNNHWDGAGCSGMGGECNENTRWEALTGEDVSSVIEASRADSAEGRVITMLEHLVTAHPGGDWGYYLQDGALRDEHVIIAGISHGASSTGLFASRRNFHRAVMHSGGWWRVPDDPATPIELFYGLSHTDDDQHSGHLDTWAGAGMLGDPTSIDGAAPPYGDARQLITSVANGYPHCSVVVHPDSPRDGEDYVYEPAWRYMYGVD